MKLMRLVCIAGLVFSASANAQEPAKPGPEHEVLKKMVGTWEATMKFGGMESKGTAVYKMDLGGLWLTSTFEGDFGGAKFSGRGLDGFDPIKKKYVGVWADSMSASMMVMEGSFDKEKKTMTMTGDGPGMDGKLAKFKGVTEMKDDDNFTLSMYVGDGKDPAFVINYKRK